MKKLLKKAAALMLTAAMTLPIAPATMADSEPDANLSKVYKVMPLGDSITAGWCESQSEEYQFGGYRIYLQRKLKENGYQKYVDFVGSNQSGPSELYDADNNGTNSACIAHDYSWATSKQTEVSSQKIISTYKPDVVMLQIGTNDIINQSTTTEDLLLSGLMSRLETLVDSVLKDLPSGGVLFLATIPDMQGTSATYNSDVTKYNSIVENIVSKKVSEGKNVVLVDVHGALNSKQFDDDLHPNQDGYESMGNLWYETLTAYFSDPETFLKQEKAATPAYKAIENPFPVIPVAKDGDKFTYKGFTYKVTSKSLRTVSLIKATSKVKKKSSITIPDSVEYLSNTFRVTALGKNVLKKSKAKKITLGKNVKEIQKGALASCKKLKKLTIKSTFLATVKKGAGSGTGKKSLKIYVPSLKKSIYKKLLKKGTFKKFKLKSL